MPDGVMETKPQLRARMRRVRAAIPDRAERVGSLTTAVLDRCAGIGTGTVMAFVGIGNEPDTGALIDALLAGGFRVVLPRVVGEEIVAAEHESGRVLTTGAFGIPEPAGAAVDPREIDVVLVPGLAFTRDGRRLGQGGGFYDRLLPQLRGDCLTIGICFAEQIVADLATEPHDRIVDVVVTDAVTE